jgi:hypothetical protein
VLVHVVGAEEEPLKNSRSAPIVRPGCADSRACPDSSAAVEVQSEPRKLLAIEIAQAGADRDVASR